MKKQIEEASKKKSKISMATDFIIDSQNIRGIFRSFLRRLTKASTEVNFFEDNYR